MYVVSSKAPIVAPRVNEALFLQMLSGLRIMFSFYMRDKRVTWLS